MIQFKRCYLTLNVRGSCMGLFSCSGGGAEQNVKVYIKNLIIIESQHGRIVDFTPTLAQKIKSYLGIFPSKQMIENAVRKNILGENDRDRTTTY